MHLANRITAATRVEISHSSVIRENGSGSGWREPILDPRSALRARFGKRLGAEDGNASAVGSCSRSSLNPTATSALPRGLSVTVARRGRILPRGDPGGRRRARS